MFFLLRMAFWLGLVLILLPTGSEQSASSARAVGASQAISAASATVEDLRGFCGRQPEACTVGSQMATELGYKAKAGAKMLYDVLSETLAPHDTGAVGSTTTPAGTSRLAGDGSSSPQQLSQDTLTPADLAPSWRGPRPRKDSARRDVRNPA